MSKATQISDAEWDVMKVVWEQGPLTAGEVVRQLPAAAGRDWRPRTIKTLLGRLVKKGAVEVRAEGSRFMYRPRVTREQCARQESRSFLSRVFDGSVAPALLHFLDGARLSREEIQQLRQTLEREASEPPDAVDRGGEQLQKRPEPKASHERRGGAK